MTDAQEREPVVEYAQLFAGGSMLVRPNDAEVDKLWSVEEWTKVMIEQGSHVYQRTVIVVSDWKEVRLS